jgi:DNA-binding protein H-NS
MNLKSMSIDRLIDLRQRVNAALNSKIVDQRRTLESELSKLTRYGGAARSKSVRFGARGKVAPKYRNPDDHSETWAGRGLKPRWLAVAIKAGKNPEDFLIAGAAKSPAARPRKKSSKARM